MLIIIVALTLVGVVTLVLWNHFTHQPDPNAAPTIDEINALSFETQEITTNLLSNDFARATFLIHVENKKALQEIQKREFQVENIILRTLSGKRSSDLAGPEGIEGLEEELRNQMNELMQEGSVVKIYTTSWVIQ